MISYIPTDQKNLRKHTHFNPKKKGDRGYKIYQKAELQIKVKGNTLLTSQQFEATRRLLSKLKKDSDAIIKFQHIQTSLSKKPLQTRMGKGKGKPFNKWVLPVRNGQPVIAIYNEYDKEKFVAMYPLIKRKYNTSLKLNETHWQKSEQVETENDRYKWKSQTHN